MSPSRYYQQLTILGSVEQGGVGYHIGYLAETNPEAIPNFFKYLLAISAWYLVIVNLPKLAILVVYRRLFPQKKIALSPVWPGLCSYCRTLWKSYRGSCCVSPVLSKLGFG